MALIDEYQARTGRYIDEASVVRNIIERATGAPKQIDSDHAYIHDGRLFTALTQNTLLTGASRYISIVTPSSAVYVHYRNEIVSSSADKVTVELFEGATVTASTGSAKASINHHRVGTPTASAVLVRDGVTVTGEGTMIYQSYIGGGTNLGAGRSGAETQQGNEFVLRPDTVYVVKLTNGSSGSNTIQCNPTWYEEEAG